LLRLTPRKPSYRKQQHVLKRTGCLDDLHFLHPFLHRRKATSLERESFFFLRAVSKESEKTKINFNKGEKSHHPAGHLAIVIHGLLLSRNYRRYV